MRNREQNRKYIFNKFYSNIANHEFKKILFEIKTLITNIPNLEESIRFKIEFTLEELLTNSFSHLNINHSSVDIQICLFIKGFRIEYHEIGVDDLNFVQILKEAQKRKLNNSFEQNGGLGLSLVQQVSKNFKYRYDESKKTRCIEASFL